MYTRALFEIDLNWKGWARNEKENWKRGCRTSFERIRQAVVGFFRRYVSRTRIEIRSSVPNGHGDRALPYYRQQYDENRAVRRFITDISERAPVACFPYRFPV